MSDPHCNIDPARASVGKATERRLELMRELTASLEQACAAVVHSDLKQIQSQTARQQRLCEELRRWETQAGLPALVRAVGRARNPWVQLPEGAVSPASGERWRSLSEDLERVEVRVASLNRTYAALLRRARRTIDIFCRVLANSGTTYAPPAREAEPEHAMSR